MPPTIDASVRFSTAVPVADRITTQPDRHAANISDTCLLLIKETMDSVRGQNHKKPPVAKIANIGLPRPLASSPCRPAQVGLVFFDELRVNSLRILRLRYVSGHVEPVAVRKQVARQQLHEPFNARHFMRMSHIHRYGGAGLFCGTNPPKKAKRACKSTPPGLNHWGVTGIRITMLMDVRIYWRWPGTRSGQQQASGSSHPPAALPPVFPYRPSPIHSRSTRQEPLLHRMHRSAHPQKICHAQPREACPPRQGFLANACPLPKNAPGNRCR